MKHFFLRSLLVICGLVFWVNPPTARAEVFSEIVGAISYLKAPAGSYGSSGGLRFEMLEPDGFGFLPAGCGFEFGVLSVERALRAGGVKFGFNTYHLPLTFKFHFMMNYVAGIGYSADLSAENRSVIHGPKASFGYITDSGLTWIATAPLNFTFELQYLYDLSQKDTMSAWMLLAGIRY